MSSPRPASVPTAQDDLLACLDAVGVDSLYTLTPSLFLLLSAPHNVHRPPISLLPIAGLVQAGPQWVWTCCLLNLFRETHRTGNTLKYGPPSRSRQSGRRQPLRRSITPPFSRMAAVRPCSRMVAAHRFFTLQVPLHLLLSITKMPITIRLCRYHLIESMRRRRRRLL